MLLELEPDAPLNEVRQAHRERHPDHVPKEPRVHPIARKGFSDTEPRGEGKLTPKRHEETSSTCPLFGYRHRGAKRLRISRAGACPQRSRGSRQAGAFRLFRA